MKTSRNSVHQIEQYLNGELSAEDSLVFDANLLVDPLLRMNVFLQKKIYSVINLYARKKLKAEIEQVHNHLFENPEKIGFQDRIHQLFKKS
jgi:hypothetical protein